MIHSVWSFKKYLEYLVSWHYSDIVTVSLQLLTTNDWPSVMDGLFFKLMRASWCSSVFRTVSEADLCSAAQMSSNWELLAQKSTHSQTRGGSRPLIQLCPLSLMSLNDYNILACHNLANTCQFSVRTRPIGYLPRLWPGSNDDVQFNISVDLYSKASESEREGRVSILVMISSSTSGHELWHLTC